MATGRLPPEPRGRSSILLALALLLVSTTHSAAAQHRPLEGAWTGGFMLHGAWVAVNLRVAASDDSSGDRADVLFPSYGGGENVINGPVENLRGFVHFEIPVRTGRIVFDGRSKRGAMGGNFVYGKTKSVGGLTRWAYVPVDSLEKFYGAYRVAPDRVISILRGWGHPRTLNYVDYKTGQVGTLWPSSPIEFYSGVGLAGSYPVQLRVSFDRDAAGSVHGLSWRAARQLKLTASKFAFIEKRITATNGDITIAGTLILPSADQRYPVVIVTPGDYGTHRNQLRLWAHNYVSRGIAAFIFDARGGGESAGPVASSSFSDLADDVVACVNMLKARPEIRPDAIGLFGFSNSCWTVTLAASRSPDVAFLVLQSLVGVEPWKQDVFRTETQLRVDGFPESVVKQGADFDRMKFEVARTGEGWDRLQAIMGQPSAARWIPYTNPPGSLDRLRQSWERSMSYDPVPAFERLKIPILAMWGTTDTYVPVTKTVEVFRRAMAKAGNHKYVVKVYPGCTHSLLVEATGSPSTGGTEKNFAPGVWDMTAGWVLERVGGAK